MPNKWSEREAAVSLICNLIISGGCLPSLTLDGGKRNMTTHISIREADPRSQAVMSLIHDMLQEEAVRYRDLGEHSDSFTPGDALVPDTAFLLASIDGHPVGCGALRRIDSERAEIKRMYVVPAARRQGVGRAILQELERVGFQFGYGGVRLETGNRQPEAIALYESRGFYRIPSFGEYIGDPVSICFEKIIREPPAECVERTGGSRLAQLPFERQRRVPPVAHADLW